MAQRSGAFLLFFVLALSPAPARENGDWRPADDLLFKIAVFGPSDEIFIWWGHAALIVENTRWNYSRVFDWGIFSYPGDSFLKSFVREEVRYKCTSGGLDMDMYVNEDRDIDVYTLDLDREAKEIILAYAENLVLPENCYYGYHEFRDNCSTRIRDIIDMGTGGQLKAAFGGEPGRFTTREQIRRFTWSRPFSEWFLCFMMGQNLDDKITVWDEMFLPVEIARNIVDFKYRDTSGEERRLVSSAEILHRSKKRPPVLNRPLASWPFASAAGLFAAALILCVKRLEKKYRRAGRISLGIIQAGTGLFLGAAGGVLVFGFSMSNDYFQQNVNVLFINPLLLAVTPLGVLYAANKRFPAEPGKLLKIIWSCVFIAGGVTVIIRILPFFYQQNQSVQALVLPPALVLSGIPGNFRKLKVFLKRLRAKKGGNVPPGERQEEARCIILTNL